ncbi:hypothetical protein C8R45DRAFT_1096661 [Mycena sanguinolenta]|nr:hypothetical protein C8R45DRAFT_1096661 [Mycena sanguinolenta]
MAYRPLTQVWRRHATDPYLGFFSVDFITELSALRRTLDWRFNDFQKMFKSTSNTWARRPLFPTLQDITNLYGATTWDDAVDMDDSLIGVWVNGLKEHTVLIFLALQIPCFIIHKYEGVDDPLWQAARLYHDFLEGTDASNLLALNVYESVARANPYQLDAIYMPSNLATMSVASTIEDRRQSSSVYLEGLMPQRIPTPPWRRRHGSTEERII